MNSKNERTYRDVADEGLLRAAAAAIDEEIMEEFERAAADETLPAPDPARAARLLERVGAGERRVLLRRRARRGFARCGKRAAVFVGAAGILFGGLFVSVDAFRESVINFIYSRQQTHTDIIRFDENDNQAAKPEEWPNDYYPAWIPGGFALEQVRVTEDYMAGAWYRNGERTMLISFYPEYGNLGLNTEGLTSREIEMEGYRALLSVSPDDTHSLICIFVEECIVLISGDLPENEILRCAGSIPLKK